MQLHKHTSGETCVPRIIEVKGGAEGKRESQADPSSSAEPELGLNPRTLKSWPELNQESGA